MGKTFENISDIIIQTATPQGIGNGFYLSAYKLIITKLSLTYGADELVISGKHIPKTLAKVIFADPVFDLAFIEAPESVLFPKVKFVDIGSIKENDKLMRVAQFYGQPVTTEKVVVTGLSVKEEGVNLLQYTTGTSGTCRGALLINLDNEIVGMDSSLLLANDKQKYALPVDLLKKILDEFTAFSDNPALRCPHCKKTISKNNLENQNCPKCGAKIAGPIIYGTKHQATPTGIKIEEIIRKLNYEVAISRAGLNKWEIEEGSTKIRVRHDVENKFIIADAILCKTPNENKSSIYEYLLKENNYLKGLSFKLKENELILSMMHIHENDFHVQSASRQFKELFNKADDYDDILIEMGAIPLNDEE